MTKVNQWKPGQGVDREQTITYEEHVRNRMPSDHGFKGHGRECDWCGRRRDVHLLSEAI